MPEAPMTDVADEVSGASTDLVERVLREYGDPAAVESDPDGQTASDGGPASPHGTASDDGPNSANGTAPASEVGASDAESSFDAETSGDGQLDGSSATDGGPTDEEASVADAHASDATASEDVTAAAGEADDERTKDETVTDDPAEREPEELSEKERAVLEAVAERPTATQQEVADELGVSRATVSKRASGIEGFDWQHRAAYVDELFDDEAALSRGTSESSTVSRETLERTDAKTDGDRRPSGKGHGARTSGVDAAEVATRLDRIEDRLDRLEPGEERAGGIADPELAHKVVHACMESEHVDEGEELRVVAAVLNGGPGN